jgi:tetrahydromethanopterin S-methyltransferase subunit G
MAVNRNGIWQLAATGLCGALFAVTMAWVNSIADDVAENKEYVQQHEGAKVVERLEVVEKKVDKVEDSVMKVHYEQKVGRGLMNRIARKLDVEEAPEVEDLPEEPE